MEFVTPKERNIAINGLGCFIQALQGRLLTVDLRNESSITGIAKEVDGYMNIIMENAVYQDSEDNTYNYDVIYVKARNIRYIHIPNHICVRDTIVKHLSKLIGRGATKKTTALERYRSSKLHQKQAETRAIVENMKKNKELQLQNKE